MKIEVNSAIIYTAALLAFSLSFGVNSIGMVFAVLPGFLFSYFLLECRKTVRLLLSVPLTILLVLVPAWVLNIFAVPVNGTILIALSLAYSSLFAFVLHGKKINLDAKLDAETVLIFILIFAAAIMTLPLHSGLMPRTDGTSHYYKVWQIREGLDTTGHISLWDSGWYAGYALFDFYPPMSYYFTALLSYFTTSPLNAVFDYVMILSYIFLAVGVFILSRELGLNKLSGFLAGLVIISSPRLATNTMFSGQFPTILAFSLVPISMYIFIRALSEKKTKLHVLSGMLLGTVFLIHHLTGYFLTTLFLLAFSIFSLKKRAFDFKNLFRVVITSALVLAFWIIPFFVNIGFSEYSKKSAIGFNPDVFLVLTTSPDKTCNDYWCFESMGMEFTVMAIAGALIWLGGVAASRGKISISPKIGTGSIIAVSMLLGVLVLALAPFIGITNYLPFGSSFGAERFTFYLILPLAILCGAVLELVNGLQGKDFLVGGTILILVLAGIFLWKYMDLVNFRAAEWNTEDAPLNTSGLSDMYAALRSIPDGRVMTYGIFQGAIVGAIPLQTGKGVISGWQPQSSPNYKDVAGKLEDISGQSLFNFNISNKFVYTIFKQSWVRWVVVNLCSPEGARAVNSTFTKDERYLFVWRNGNSQGCLVLLEVPQTSFAETVEPVGVLNDTQKIKESLHDTENGYQIHFTKRLSDIPQNEYRIIINKDVIWDDSLAADIADIASSDFKPLAWQRNGNEIIVSNTAGWTLIKETYYPLWSAYNGNKKLKIYETDLGFMLVKSEGNLELKIEKPLYYTISSLITFIGFVLILSSIILEKTPSHNPDKEPDPVL
ncbi:MAG: hypothetical protein HYT71_00900 [Candidatus Aenigmarchaeota archaeon]|nr:hypothetical protein [Candidatus Aenigmarchaeota archaeon]